MADVVELGGVGSPPVLSGYLVLSCGVGALVDAGPASVADEYVRRARARTSGSRLEYVLITHVHLDHAGGTRRVLELEPGARAAVYSRGAKHLVDPSRLLESSRGVLGDIVDVWGGMEPVDSRRLVVLEDGEELAVGCSKARLIATPGHAPHSSAWYLPEEGVLFAGDSAGMLLPGEGGAIWPLAPPPFRMDLFLDSLSKMETLSPELLCVSHFGCVRDVRDYLREVRRRYLEVDEAVAEACERGLRGHALLEYVLSALGIRAPAGRVEEAMLRNIKGLPGYSRCTSER